jgi:hypothetical protein
MLKVFVIVFAGTLVVTFGISILCNLALAFLAWSSTALLMAEFIYFTLRLSVVVAFIVAAFIVTALVAVGSYGEPLDTSPQATKMTNKENHP